MDNAAMAQHTETPLIGTTFVGRHVVVPTRDGLINAAIRTRLLTARQLGRIGTLPHTFVGV